MGHPKISTSILRMNPIRNSARTYFGSWCKPIFTVLFLSILLPIEGEAQKVGQLDSLLNRLEGPFISDSMHADAYRQLANYHIEFSASEEALIYLDSLRLFSQKADYPLGELFYHYGSAYYYFRRGGYDSITVHLLGVVDLSKFVNKPGWTADALNKLAIVSSIQGKLDTARSYLDEAIRISFELADADLISMNILALGDLEAEAGNYEAALKHFISVDSLFVAIDEVNYYRHGVALQNIGNIYFDKINNPDKALEYFSRARDAFIAENNDRGEVDAVNKDMALVYKQKGNFLFADSLLRVAVQGFNSRGHLRQVAETNIAYAGLKMDMELPQEAEALLLEAETIYTDIDDKAGLRNTFLILGSLFFRTGEFPKSALNYERALGLENSAHGRAELLRKLADVYQQLGQTNKALQSLNTYVFLSDSLSEKQLETSLQEIESRYQSTQKEKEISDLKLSQAQQKLRSQKLLYGGGISLVSLGFISFFFFNRARHRQKINAQLTSLDRLRSKLFADISHEFRTPLSLIRGPVQILLKKDDIQPDTARELKLIDRNAQRLNRLVDSVNALSQLDAGKMTLSIRPINLIKHLKVIAASFESLAMAKGLTFTQEYEGKEEMYHYDPRHLETILYNLLSNAFKFTETGEVKLKLTTGEGVSEIRIEDTGRGMSSQDQKRVFERYFRGSDERYFTDGVGIGLALANELARLHHGSIGVTSSEGKGTAFTLICPTSRSYYENKGYDIGETYLPALDKKVESAAVSKESKVPSVLLDEPLLLLVEDNPDMREHLDSVFTDEYRILTAKDGRKGLELAQNYVPDLIISDLMMPVMDGQKFLEALKSDERTSHIPFIMLTANHLEKEKLKGLELGADDFMTKPFSIDEITIKVRNLIRTREELQSRYRMSGMIEPSKLATNDADQQFWQRLKEVVTKHLNNAEFTAEDFAMQMHMSRMQLHRKLKALTDLSTTAFLRSQRLKAAAQLIREGNGSVSDIAYSVGFTSPFYFSKCFKEVFGVSPKDYAN